MLPNRMPGTVVTWHCCTGTDTTSTLEMDIYSESVQVELVAFQLGTVVHLHAWKGEQFFFMVGLNISQLFRNICSEGTYLWGSKFNVTDQLHTCR